MAKKAKQPVSGDKNQNRKHKSEMGIIRRGEVYPLAMFGRLAAGGEERAAVSLLIRLGVRIRNPIRGVKIVIGDEYIDALEKFGD